MAFCRKCGREIDDEAVICPFCGVKQEKESQPVDNGGIGWGILGCCVPLAGLILWLVWKDTKPKSAKAAGIGALVSVGLSVFWYIIAVVAGVGAGFYNFF